MIHKALDRYKLLLKGFPPVKFETEMRPSIEDAMRHCAWMIGKMDKMMKHEEDKFNRWLGFIQGVFFAFNIYSIEQMRGHNKSEPCKECDDMLYVEGIDSEGKPDGLFEKCSLCNTTE